MYRMKENTVKITQNEGPNSIGSRGSVLLTITGDRLSNDELMDYGKDYLNDGDFQSANLIFNYVKNLAEKVTRRIISCQDSIKR